MRVPIFTRKGVLWGHLSREDFPRKPGKGGVLQKKNTKQWLPVTEIGGIFFPRDRGNQVMGNEHRYLPPPPPPIRGGGGR